MMEQNYKLGLALRGPQAPEQNQVAMVVDEGDMDDISSGGDDHDDDDDDMMVEKEVKRKKRGRASEEFKAKVMGILENNDFAEKRASKMSQDDFLQLLAQFNESGIHFV